MTIPALAPLFRGPLERFSDSLTLAPVEGARAAADLLNRETLGALIERLAADYGDGDRRAVASIWSKSHFSALMPVVLAANLLLDLDLPVTLGEVALVADERGRTRRFALPHGGEALGPEAGETRFDRLIDGHLEPLIAALAAVSGASPKVFWSNAGNVFDFIVRGAGDLGADAAGVEAGLALMAARRRRGRPNPLYAPVSYPAGGRVRRVCCLRYLASGVGYCGTCPVIPEGAAAAD